MKQATPALEHIVAELGLLETRGLLRRRQPATAGTAPELSFCSNDYLGLADRLCQGSSGAGASRLVSGDRKEHQLLEAALASWLGTASAIVFSSGYAANVGALSCLASEGDLIISDELNHASLIDGARLSRARVAVVRHLDVNAVARALRSWKTGRRWVVTESYFSMDGDSPDLARLRTLCDEERAALYVDEAHALGVLGPEGRGLCAEAGVRPDVLVGTLGKALGAAGAFVAGGEALTLWLWNRARSFVFSTGLSPVVAQAGLDGLSAAIREPQLRERVLAAAAELRAGLQARGIHPGGWGHVIPWIVGAPERAVRVASLLGENGIRVVAIRPPSVPERTARLRLTVTAIHSGSDVERLLAAVDDVDLA